MTTSLVSQWPRKRDLFGVGVSVTNYDQAVDAIFDAAVNERGGVATFLAVHGIVSAATNREFRQSVNRCDIVAPDGQPVRWALNYFHQAALADRVYGPEIMRRVCERCEKQGLSIFLCGSTRPVLALLASRLRELFPNLKLAGVESPPFRPMTPAENDELCTASTKAAPPSSSSASVSRARKLSPISIAKKSAPSSFASAPPSISTPETKKPPPNSCSATASNGSSVSPRNPNASGKGISSPTASSSGWSGLTPSSASLVAASVVWSEHRHDRRRGHPFRRL